MITLFLFRRKNKQMIDSLFKNVLLNRLDEENTDEILNVHQINHETNHQTKNVLLNRLNEEYSSYFCNVDQTNYETTLSSLDSTLSREEVIGSNCIINVDASLFDLFQLKSKTISFHTCITIISSIDLVVITFAFIFRIIILGGIEAYLIIRLIIIILIIWMIIGPIIVSFLFKSRKQNVSKLNVINSVRALEFIMINDHSYNFNLNSTLERRSVQVKYNHLSKLSHELIQ
jgi:hypothetical protein